MSLFNTPVLIIAWRRPKHLINVINALRTVAPNYVFVAVDGPRVGVEYDEERKLIAKTKKVIESEIDWNCDLKTMYREENYGCARGVSSAITWFFSYCEEGIILEDDIVITRAGLLFLEQGLRKYRGMSDIWMVSAWKPFKTFGLPIIQDYFYCWGWATWKRAWINYSLEIPNFNLRYSRLGFINEHWSSIFMKVRDIDTWDYQMQYWMFVYKAKAVLPPRNYVDNIGFDLLAHHTKGVKPDKFKIRENPGLLDSLTITIPKVISDILDYKLVRNDKWTIQRLKRKIRLKLKNF